MKDELYCLSELKTVGKLKEREPTGRDFLLWFCLKRGQWRSFVIK